MQMAVLLLPVVQQSTIRDQHTAALMQNVS